MIRLKTSILLFLTVTVLTGQNSYTISGTVSKVGKEDKVFFYYGVEDAYVVDSCNVEDGSFLFKGAVEYPVQAILVLTHRDSSVEDDRTDLLQFYLENSMIRIDCTDSIRNASVSGSRTQDLHLELLEYLKPIKQEMILMHEPNKNKSKNQNKAAEPLYPNEKRGKELIKKNMEIINRFIKEHNTDFLSLLLLKLQAKNVSDPDQLEPLYMGLSQTLRSTKPGKQLASQLKQLKATAIGKSAPEITATDINGDSLSLSDFKGKYTLLVFWSPDCNHCLSEIPNLQKAFDLFSGKGFCILAIAVESADRKEYWNSYVKNNRLHWSNIFDEQINGISKIASHYNIQYTPYNLLLDGNGKIIAKELYADDLIAKLALVMLQ